jgi:hypothetical protein
MTFYRFTIFIMVFMKGTIVRSHFVLSSTYCPEIPPPSLICSGELTMCVPA